MLNAIALTPETPTALLLMLDAYTMPNPVSGTAMVICTEANTQDGFLSCILQPNKTSALKAEPVRFRMPLRFVMAVVEFGESDRMPSGFLA